MIYRIPQRSASLAHVVPAKAIVERPPINGLDVDALAVYAAALDDESLPLAPLYWTSRHSARIEATAYPGQLISVQETYTPGWHATVDGKDRPVTGDGIGLITIDAGCNGGCDIALNYDGGYELVLARMASVEVTLGMLCWIGLAWRKR